VSSWDGSDIYRNNDWSLFQRGGTAMVIERLANCSNEVMEGLNNVMVEEEGVERYDWIVCR